MFNTILVPLDGSPQSEAALQYALHLGELSRARIILLQSVVSAAVAGMGGSHPLPPIYYEDERRQCKEYLAGLHERLSWDNLEVETPEGLPADCILERVERGDVDLVVMTSHGRTGVERFLMGSVAERVVRHCPCPVLLVGRKAIA